MDSLEEKKTRRREAARRWRERHPEKALESARRYREANRDKVRAATAKWSAKNWHKWSEGAKRWRKQNPEKVKAQKLRTYDRHKEAAKRRSRKHYAENKARHVDSKLRRTYGISLEERDRMLAAQGGKCAIVGCARPARDVDHNHTTGAIRAMLCSRCNRVIGMLGEDAGLCDGVSGYMRAYGCVPVKHPARSSADAAKGDKNQPLLFA